MDWGVLVRHSGASTPQGSGEVFVAKDKRSPGTLKDGIRLLKWALAGNDNCRGANFVGSICSTS